MTYRFPALGLGGLLFALACTNPFGGAPSAPEPPPDVPPPAENLMDHSLQGRATISDMPADFCDADTQRDAGPGRREAWSEAWRMRGEPGVTPCDVGAFVTDPDPNGLNVRDAPASSGKVLSTLKEQPMVSVVGQKGNWFLLCDASSMSQPEIDVAGWVFGGLLNTGTRGYELGYSVLHKDPQDASPEVGRVDVEANVRILACQGEWLRVGYNGKEGWLSPGDQCANTLTTCS